MAAFREAFSFPPLTTTVSWFPGHMHKGLRLMSERLRKCDCVVEVLDARLYIPFSGRNDKFDLMLRGRPKVLVLNKVDMCNPHNKQEFLQELKRRGESEVLYTNLKSQHHPTIRQLKSMILKVTGWDRRNDEGQALRFMVVGMPNVGKSSLINALRRNYLGKGKGAGIGKLPGITKAVSTKVKVAENPTMFLVDTPGIMMPSIPNDEVVLKLAVIGMLRDHFVGEERIADYLLFKLNKSENFEYAKYCNMDSPCDDIGVVLDKFSERIGALRKGGSYDHVRAAQHFLKRYRDGLLGQLTLDTL